MRGCGSRRRELQFPKGLAPSPSGGPAAWRRFAGSGKECAGTEFVLPCSIFICSSSSFNEPVIYTLMFATRL